MVTSVLRLAILGALLSICWCESLKASERFSLPENPYAFDANRSCGPRCVAFLDRYFDGMESYDAIVRKCPPGPFGTNLEQIRTALTELGYHSVGFKASSSQLERLRHAAILHLEKQNEGGHFVVLLGWDDAKKSFLIFNPPSDLGYVDRDWIEERATGLGIVVSPQPLPPFQQLLQPARIGVGDWLMTALLAIVLLALVRRPPPAAIRIHGPVNAAVAMSFLAIPLFLASCSVDDTRPDVNRAETSAPNVYEADVGRVLDGSVIKHTFRISNTSDRPFRIIRVRRSCSCQVVQADTDRDIPPGGIAEISVEVPTVGREGPYRQEFQVEAVSGGGVVDEIRLALSANVEAKIKAIPSQVMFGTVAAGEAAEARVTVKTNKPDLGENFASAIAIGNPYLKIQLRDRAVGFLTFDVTLASDAPAGDVFGKIQLEFNDDDVPSIVLPVLGRKIGHLKAIPRVLTMRAAQAHWAKVRIASENGAKFKISSISSPPGVRVDWEQDVDQSSFDLLIETEADIPPDSFVLKIKTDFSQQPEIQVPCVVQAGS